VRLCCKLSVALLLLLLQVLLIELCSLCASSVTGTPRYGSIRSRMPAPIDGRSSRSLSQSTVTLASAAREVVAVLTWRRVFASGDSQDGDCDEHRGMDPLVADSQSQSVAREHDSELDVVALMNASGGCLMNRVPPTATQTPLSKPQAAEPLADRGECGLRCCADCAMALASAVLTQRRH
jgi:hypothetical protein